MNANDAPLGIIHNLPGEKYHGGPGISNSGLKDFAQSPAHYYARHLDPARPPPRTRAGQLEGNLAHCAILEPGEFDKRYAVYGQCINRNTNAWKAFAAEAEAAGKVAIQPDQYDTAMAQAASVRRLADVAELFSRGHAEVSAFWIDQPTGELCRCRPDWVFPTARGDGAVILVDVKTCSDASPAEFARQVGRKAYHVQDAYYCDGYGHASGLQVLGMVFVAVEMEYPYAASACSLDDDGRERGRAEYRRLLDLYAAARRANHWPGYSETIELIEVPAWAA